MTTALELRRPVYRNVASRVIDYDQVTAPIDTIIRSNGEGDSKSFALVWEGVGEVVARVVRVVPGVLPF